MHVNISPCYQSYRSAGLSISHPQNVTSTIPSLSTPSPDGYDDTSNVCCREAAARPMPMLARRRSSFPLQLILEISTGPEFWSGCVGDVNAGKPGRQGEVDHTRREIAVAESIDTP